MFIYASANEELILTNVSSAVEKIVECGLTPSRGRCIASVC